MADLALRIPRSARLSTPSDTYWRKLDFWLIGAAIGLGGLGALLVTSATFAVQKANGNDPYFYLERQVLFLILGVVLMVVTAMIDYRRIVHAAPFVYVATLAGLAVLLVAPSAIAPTIKGIKAWYRLGPFQIQPAELAKISVIIVLAAYGAAQRNQLDTRRVFTMIGLAAVPMVLIFRQPDLGTALVFAFFVVVMVWVAGATPWHLLAMLGSGVGVAILALRVGLLQQYQLDRLLSFLNSDRDLSGAGYNVAQSKIAIGSGGTFGQGLFAGSQTESGFVPERHTDFIFSVVGEQLGFIGGLTLILLFALLLWRILRTATLSRDLAGTLVCVGVFAMFLFQIFENVGMNMQIMPVTGIPLPFISHGGSSLWASFMGIGLVINVGTHRFR